MEKTADAVVVPLDAGWSDVGSWSALHEASDPDANGNVARGDVLVEDSKGCYLHSESRLVAAVGLRTTWSSRPRTPCWSRRRSRVQDVKKLVARLKELGRYEHSLHREVFRPWGSYDSIESGARFQVKTLKVKPGAEMSLQMHHHRAEHWVVVSGTARITRGEEIFLLEENQSTYIPDRRQAPHRESREDSAAHHRSAVRARISARTTSCASRIGTVELAAPAVPQAPAILGA